MRYDTVVRQQDLRKLDRKWIDTNIVYDVGVNKGLIMNFSKLLTCMNGERLAGNR